MKVHKFDVVAPYAGEDFSDLFRVHFTTPSQLKRSETICELAVLFAGTLSEMCPPGADFDNAIVALQECVSWACLSFREEGETDTAQDASCPAGEPETCCLGIAECRCRKDK